MPELFENSQLKNIDLKNRFVRSATWEGLAADDGSCGDRLIEFMARLARGGVGLIITGHAYVRSDGKAGPGQLGIYKDEFITGLSKMTDAVHNEGSKIFLQLAHAGSQANAKLSEAEPAGPSVFESNGKPVGREMGKADIAELIGSFGKAASRAKEAGFDGVQIHAAHGYIFSQFLSPFYNKRTDEYGGSLENRARALLEVYRTVRNVVGNDFAVTVKLNSEDFLEGGFTKEEMLLLSSMLEKEGVDAIEMSGGTMHSGVKLVPVRAGRIDSEEREAYYRNTAEMFKERINVPLILVGGIRSYNVADELVNNGIADYISMSRPLICDPDIINRWQAGDHTRSWCRSDNLCFRPGYRGKGIYCVTREKENN